MRLVLLGWISAVVAVAASVLVGARHSWADHPPPPAAPAPARVRSPPPPPPVARPATPRPRSPAPTPTPRQTLSSRARSVEDVAASAGRSSDTVGAVPEFFLHSAELTAVFMVAQTQGKEVPRWREGAADEELVGLDSSTGGAIAVLYSPWDPLVWRMLRSVCSKLAAPHPLLMFWVEEPGPTPAVRHAVTVAATHGCLAARQVWFVRIPAAVWEAVGSAGREGLVSGKGGYRRMCWFWHRSVFTLPCLQNVSLLMRLDTDSEIVTRPATDPIAAVAARGASYGYVSFCFDNPDFTRGLWQHAARSGLTSAWPNFTFPARRCSPSPPPPGAEWSAGTGDHNCPVPMFFTNFEVLRLSFFRRPAVRAWMESVREGVVSRRWGDAPLRALTIGLFASPSESVHLTDFAYRHGRKGAEQRIGVGNQLSARWDLRRPPLGDLDVYYLGICTSSVSAARAGV
eukprot:TRINITY_DN40753_c0_g1_i1.p1 TRINITY_DN40753_c0_g1~~TRINITY_DN40753_c0_g1_i1.p1  ORF type:complete len:457 (+),score=105.16 TRINITY_DN40753_c0_g1_i1:51-1421(+)